ncbi:cytochrome c-type biogenesis protein [Sphingomicrobium nitratireducens]|uniref:cytochrome c-type biogenesis protein n=1 Tax=Sphingomicrobium nitratireducens TaxID=2964666 RepID=UPI00223FC7D8|nr:cytochrome c-type biogenesis protein [Sphingomicrobium nitratireducens]
MRRFLLALLLLAAPAWADSEMPDAEYANRQLEDPRAEAEAHALMQELRCLVCEGQSIADSNAEMAGDMRHLVRTRIAAGEDKAEVREWLVERYGEWVTYRPRTSNPLSWPLWIAPLALVAVGLWMVRGRFRMTRGEGE